MASGHPGFRIFILGAGFSKSAGLPLASELFPLAKAAIESEYGRDTKFQRDLENYLRYRRECDGVELDERKVDLEELMSFWDIEHFLWLRGKDTWSDEGNESQLMIRKAIGRVIHSRTPSLSDIPDAYLRFAEGLSVNDYVLSFNYDILLERALERVGKSYRLFPERFKSIGWYSNEVDSEKEEVVLLKLHGSVDWFSNKQFLESKASLEAQGLKKSSLHTVFDDVAKYKAEPLVDGIRSESDPLTNIFRIRDPDSYYYRDSGFNAPFLLSPSHVKFLYAPPLLDFWRGLSRAGGYNLGLSVIGFSLPHHDEYIRQILYAMVSNYQNSSWDQKFLSEHKDNVKFIDFRNDPVGIKDYKSRYSFSDQTKSRFWLDGFSESAVKFLFTSSRET